MKPASKFSLTLLILAIVIIPSLWMNRRADLFEANAEGTVKAAAQLLQTHALSGDHANQVSPVAWPAETEQALRLVGGRARTSDVAAAIKKLIAATGQAHTVHIDRQTYSRIMSPASDHASSLGEVSSTHDGFALLRLNRYVNINEAVYEREALALRAKVVASLKGSPCGVIVDLTSHTGGNVIPMLSAVAPLLPNGPVFFHEDKQNNRTPVPRPGLSNDEVFSHQPIAVLAGPRTGSSGEYVLVALRASRKTLVFGQATFGFTTGNSVFELPNGSALAITTSRLLDHWGDRVSGKIQPDVHEPTRGAALRSASRWLRESCNAQR